MSNARAPRRLLSLCVVLCLPVAAGAQQAVTLATVSGRVEDPTGAPVAGVSVTAASQERGQSWSTTTDDRGRFRFLYLPVDTYELRAEQPPFRPAHRRVSAHRGPGRRRAAPPGVEGRGGDGRRGRRRAARGNACAPRSARPCCRARSTACPLNGRNYLDLAALTPGRHAHQPGHPTSASPRPRRCPAPGSPSPASGPSTTASSSTASRPTTTRRTCRARFYSQEVIREFQVITSGGIAEFGRASAGIVNIVTQSGTNDWQRARLRLPARRRASTRATRSPRPRTRCARRSTARPPRRPAPARPDLLLRQLRADAAGHGVGVITIRPASVAAINARLEAVGYRGSAHRHRPLRHRLRHDQRLLPRRSPPRPTQRCSRPRATAFTTSRATTRATSAA